ncbi:hypothetical protein NT07LI_0959a, partial [Listeria innocua FSL S4-378]
LKKSPIFFCSSLLEGLLICFSNKSVFVIPLIEVP